MVRGYRAGRYIRPSTVRSAKRAVQQRRKLYRISKVAKRLAIGSSRIGLRTVGYAGLAAGGAYMAYRGIRRIKRARARQKVRRQLGSKPRSLVKRAQGLQQDVQLGDCTLHSWDISQLGYAATLDAQKVLRVHDTVHICGYKIDWNLNNLASEPVTVVAYVASPKQWIPGTTDPSTVGQELLTNYDGIAQAIDFTTGLSAQEYLHNPINGNKWSILKKFVWKLNGKQGETNAKPVWPNRDSSVQTSNYIPIKRQFNYEDNIGQERTKTEHPPVYLLYWCVRNNQPSGGTPQYTVQSQLRIVTFFREKD